MILLVATCCVLLLVLGVPVAIVLGSAATLSLVFFTDTPLTIIAQQIFDALNKSVLLAIPFFILAGAIMTRGGIARRLINFVNALVGWFPGGLGIAGTFACIFFAAISGSSPATVVAVGSIMIPALIKAGYGTRFSTGLITTAGSLGIIIPPSIPMILYCLVMNVSVERIFLAGVVPGLMIGLFLMIYTFFIAQREQWQIEKRPSLKEIVVAVKKGFWALLLPIVVLGGIYMGMCTPTEAAAVSVVYALVVEIFIYKELRISEITAACQQAAVLSACLLFLLACAVTFLYVLTSEQIPQQLADIIMGHIQTPWGFLLCVNILFIIMGCFMDDVSAMMILAPLFHETLNRYNIDLVHFGIIMILNIQLGMLTPPFGLNLFISAGLTNTPLATVTRGVIPFLVIMLICLFLVTYIPAISLFLPNLLPR